MFGAVTPKSPRPPFRLRSTLLALIAVVVPACACADVTAVYRRPGATSGTTVEVASDGSVRVDDGPDGYRLWRGGRGYQVTAGPGGPRVWRVSDIAAARAGANSPGHHQQPWVPLGPVIIAGRTGFRYKIRGAETNPGASSLVISQDPALAALGEAFRRLDAMTSALFPGEDSVERTSRRRLLSTGAPISYYDQELASISRAAIPPARFRLPAHPLSRAEAQAEWAPPAQEPPPSEEERRREHDRFIKRAVFAENRLWMLTDSGRLSTAAAGAATREPVEAPGPVTEMCATAGAPILLTSDKDEVGLWRRAGGKWTRAGTLPPLGQDRVLTLSCTPTRLVVLTTSRVFVVEGEGLRTLALAAPITGPIVATSPLDTGTALVVGLDAGEWGGGLLRIDLASGAVDRPSRSTGELCSGPLNPACDPVNGVARSPGRPDCLVAAVGLVHFSAHGRLVEVCGAQVRRLYYKPFTAETSWPIDPPVEPRRTVPFFGLAATGAGLWAVAGDGLYQIPSRGPPRHRPLPAFHDVDGVALSFAVPGLVLVRTAINARVAISGSAPLLVAR